MIKDNNQKKMYELRKAKKMSVTEFCKKLGISTHSYYSYLYGRRKTPVYIMNLLDYIEKEHYEK